MRKVFISFAALFLIAPYCKTAYSITSIEPKKSFVMGDNEHELFEATLKNTSNNEVELIKMPNNEVKTTIQILEPGESVSATIEKNIALRR